MSKLLHALSFMHSRNIMHRDLKPDNILLRSSKDISSVVIADYGLATYALNNDQIFKRCGTPGYVAPEVLAYKENMPFYTTKCDMFSIGCILYIM